MAAAKGNKYHQEWTNDSALEFMESALKLVEENKDIMFLGTIAARMHKEKNVFTYLVRRHGKECGAIKNIRDIINTIIEARLAENGLAGNTNPALTIFCLKNNYGWKDKVHNEVEGSMISINIDVEDKDL